MGTKKETACSTVPMVNVASHGHLCPTGAFKDVLERLGVNNILGVRGAQEPGSANHEDPVVLICEVDQTMAENGDLDSTPITVGCTDDHESGDTKENRVGSFLDQFLVRDAATFQAKLLQRSASPCSLQSMPLSISESEGQLSADRVESLSQWLPVSPCGTDTPTSALAGPFHFHFPRDPVCSTDAGTTSTSTLLHVLTDLPKSGFGMERPVQPYAPSSQHVVPLRVEGADPHSLVGQHCWMKMEEGIGRAPSVQLSNGYLPESAMAPLEVGLLQADQYPNRVVWPFSNDVHAPNRDPWLPPSLDSHLAMMQVVGPLGWSSLTGAPVVTTIAEDRDVAGEMAGRH